MFAWLSWFWEYKRADMVYPLVVRQKKGKAGALQNTSPIYKGVTHALCRGEGDSGFVQRTHDLIDERRRVLSVGVYEIEALGHTLCGRNDSVPSPVTKSPFMTLEPDASSACLEVMNKTHTHSQAFRLPKLFSSIGDYSHPVEGPSHLKELLRNVNLRRRSL